MTAKYNAASRSLKTSPIVPVSWLPRDRQSVEICMTVMKKYRECLRRNAPAETRQLQLCDELLACWSGRGGKLKGMYEEEYSDFALSVFRQMSGSDQISSQQKQQLRLLMGGRSSSGECRRRIETVERVFKAGGKLGRKDISMLKDSGFTIDMDNRHIHLFYGGRLFLYACSPSDYRAGRNTISRIRSAIDIERCYMN